jgi:hypothetical protein
VIDPSASNSHAFATLKADGSIIEWRTMHFGGATAPAGNGYTKIYSTVWALAALKADGSITGFKGGKGSIS